MSKSNLDIRDIARRIDDEPVEDWAGRCHEIACKIVWKGIVQGSIRYGHYLGPVSRRSFFASKRHLPFIRHGWIEVATNQIIDPTRWVFEATDPYIYEGENDFYDTGGNRLREMLEAPPPGYHDRPAGVQESWFQPVPLDVPELTELWIRDRLNLPRDAPHPNLNQVAWLANLSVNRLGIHAPWIFSAIKDAGHQTLIPIDNYDLILGE